MIPCVKADALMLEESKIFPESKGLEGWVLQQHPGDEAIPGPPASIVCRAEGIKKSLREELIKSSLDEYGLCMVLAVPEDMQSGSALTCCEIASLGIDEHVMGDRE